MSQHLLAIDQGTTGTTALVMSLEGVTLGRKTVEFPQHFPSPGWVEHDANDIWQSVEQAVTGALAATGISGSAIRAIGITNQRETTLIWERKTSRPIANAIVWQDRRTSKVCDALKAEPPIVEQVRAKTGLVIDAYFSGTKIAWLLENVPGARSRTAELGFGTIDSFLVWKLSNGAVHATDVSNASRTLLMNLKTGEWDRDLCALFKVPAEILPKIVGNAERIAETRNVGFLPDGIPITGMAGDQQAALFGQACFKEGDAKCTYGTGAFALMNIGSKPILSRHGLVTTVAWRIGKETTFALEGSAFIAGAAVQWLRDGLGIIRSAQQIEELARSVQGSDGVVFVPALAGLGAPYWDQDARGTITGLTRGTTAAHLARATLEGIGFEVRDLLHAMVEDAARPIGTLAVDGGAAANNLLMQWQADIADVKVMRPVDIESTGRGAAMLAGVGVGACQLWEDVARMVARDTEFAPEMAANERQTHLLRWKDAIARTRFRPT